MRLVSPFKHGCYTVFTFQYTLNTLARVGRENSSWEGVLGRHGVGKVNNNSLLLLSKCVEHRLCITNTFFRMADKNKTTWQHPRSKHWPMIDFIIVRQRDIRDVRVPCAMRMLNAGLTTGWSGLYSHCAYLGPIETNPRLSGLPITLLR